MTEAPTSSRRQRSDAAANRVQLVEAAARILAVQPRASMASIAAEAGLGRNTIYRHFATREALLDAIRRKGSDDIEAGGEDHLRPAGELGARTPTLLSVSDVLNKVLPGELGTQIVAEALRLGSVSAAAVYLVDLDGVWLNRLAGSGSFPRQIPVDLAVGPEIPQEGIAALRDSIAQRLPGVIVAPMYLRGRALGVLLAAASEQDEDGLRELADAAAPAISVSERYTGVPGRARRVRPTTAAAEIQQNLLPPRIVRVAGAMIAANVLPGYDMGGDWFDYVDNPEGTWIGLMDTGAAGPRAAAVAAVTLGAFRASRHDEHASPAVAIRAIHDTLLQVLGDRATTRASATVAIWDGATRSLRWVTCGEGVPLLVDERGALTPMGPAHASIGDPDFPIRLRVQRRRLGRDERVLLASNGIFDVLGEDDVAFGRIGVSAAIGRAATPSAAATVRAIEDGVRAHSSGRLSDDATMMMLVPSAG